MGPSESAPLPPVRLTRTQARLTALATIFGRAFVDEPMMLWPLGSNGDVVGRFTRCFAYFLEAALPLGLVWEAGQAEGAAVWIPPEQSEAWEHHPWNQTRILGLADDCGRRYDAFWEWVSMRRFGPRAPWQHPPRSVPSRRRALGVLAAPRSSPAATTAGADRPIDGHGGQRNDLPSMRLPRLRRGRRAGGWHARLVHALGSLSYSQRRLRQLDAIPDAARSGFGGQREPAQRNDRVLPCAENAPAADDCIAIPAPDR
jgi:hypothetical protein